MAGTVRSKPADTRPEIAWWLCCRRARTNPSVGENGLLVPVELKCDERTDMRSMLQIA